MPVRDLRHDRKPQPPSKDPPTVYERLLDDETDPTEPRKPPMKTTISATFEGTPSQFMKWVEETFKNPEALQLKVTIGTAPTTNGQTPAFEPVDPSLSRFPPLAQAVLMRASQRLPGAAYVSEDNVLDVLTGAGLLYRRGDKIGAIKHIRSHHPGNPGLKEAKDFIESDAFIQFAQSVRS